MEGVWKLYCRNQCFAMFIHSTVNKYNIHMENPRQFQHPQRCPQCGTTKTTQYMCEYNNLEITCVTNCDYY